MADFSFSRSRLGKARAALPQEYHLAQFLQDISNKHLSWNTETPACKWDGVLCEDDLKIKRIQWWGRALRGIPRWVYFSNVLSERVWFNRNQLMGQLPLELFPPKLKKFSAPRNLFNGTLNLREVHENLEELTLIGCNFQGAIALHELSFGLVSLDLSRNGFSGGLNLGSVWDQSRILKLSGNNFSGPVDLLHLPYYIVLSLHNNPNLSGEYDPARFYNWISCRGTQIKTLPSRASYTCFLPIRYVFDSEAWNFRAELSGTFGRRAVLSYNL